MGVRVASFSARGRDFGTMLAESVSGPFVSRPCRHTSISALEVYDTVHNWDLN